MKLNFKIIKGAVFIIGFILILNYFFSFYIFQNKNKDFVLKYFKDVKIEYSFITIFQIYLYKNNEATYLTYFNPNRNVAPKKFLEITPIEFEYNTNKISYTHKIPVKIFDKPDTMIVKLKKIKNMKYECSYYFIKNNFNYK